MDTDLKPSWLRMSLTKLQALLRKRGYPEPIIGRILADVVEQRNNIKSKRIKNTVAYRLWDEILTPARTELNILRVLKHQMCGPVSKGVSRSLTQQDREKLYALQEYATVIASTVYKLRKVQSDGDYTPRQFVTFIRKETGRTIPHNGDHWTDYVSHKDKVRVRDLFATVPDPKRGKRKNPFERKIAPIAYERSRAQLINAMNDEAERIQQELGMTRDTFEVERLEGLLHQLQQAQNRLDSAPRNIPLPATWHGLIGL